MQKIERKKTVQRGYDHHTLASKGISPVSGKSLSSFYSTGPILGLTVQRKPVPDRSGDIDSKPRSTPLPRRVQVKESVPSGRILRRASNPRRNRVRLQVVDWRADEIKPAPTPRNNKQDARYITIPDTGQINIWAVVRVFGTDRRRCQAYKIGTTQTAWTAWTLITYKGENAGEGSLTLRHNMKGKMRDPYPKNKIWYNKKIVSSPADCDGSIALLHRDSPWHDMIPKALVNKKAYLDPLNYLHSYQRGIHLVTYLTAKDDKGKFLRRPLRFVYWNSIQSFTFTPRYKLSNFRNQWAFGGSGIKANIGAKGRGVTSDAPYYTTAGPTFNDHFNNPANWRKYDRK